MVSTLMEGGVSGKGNWEQTKLGKRNLNSQ
jgi:hypothetical protein